MTRHCHRCSRTWNESEECRECPHCASLTDAQVEQRVLEAECAIDNQIEEERMRQMVWMVDKILGLKPKEETRIP